MNPAIPTLRQYASQRRTTLARTHEVTRAEVEEVYFDDWFDRDWWSHVVARVEDGVEPSTRLWRSLPQSRRTELLRTHRALVDGAFTARLINRSHVHAAGAGHGGPATAVTSQVTCPDCSTRQQVPA
ncbi:MAG: hypothetical protein L0H93_07960 [Nocardioides sp.]|nr:hypothetical protein [Nocardioides sp.]